MAIRKSVNLIESDPAFEVKPPNLDCYNIMHADQVAMTQEKIPHLSLSAYKARRYGLAVRNAAGSREKGFHKKGMLPRRLFTAIFSTPTLRSLFRMRGCKAVKDFFPLVYEPCVGRLASARTAPEHERFKESLSGDRH